MNKVQKGRQNSRREADENSLKPSISRNKDHREIIGHDDLLSKQKQKEPSLPRPHNPINRNKAEDRGVQKQRKTRIWKTAVDPKSGRTYYYDAVSRATQWRKVSQMDSK